MNKILYKGSILLCTLVILMGCMTTPKDSSSESKKEGMSEAEMMMQKLREYYSADSMIYHDNPEDVQVMWQDFDAFWSAVDAAKQADGSYDKQAFYDSYLANKSGDLDKHSENFYGTKDGMYQNYPLIPFYQSFRSTLGDKSIFDKQVYIAHLKKLKEYYPEARFPNIHFHIGNMRQGGTAVPLGIIIAPEVFQKDVGADYSKLDGKMAKIAPTIFGKNPRKNLESMNIHEVMHFQQIFGKDLVAGYFNRDLLNTSLIEGTAEFLSSVITGGSILADDVKAYGKANETELWQKFKEDRKAGNPTAWLYNGNKDRGGVPADMGYWVGFRIAKSYWDNMEDKQQAFRDILLWDDADEFLEKSGYDVLHSKNK